MDFQLPMKRRPQLRPPPGLVDAPLLQHPYQAGIAFVWATAVVSWPMQAAFLAHFSVSNSSSAA